MHTTLMPDYLCHSSKAVVASLAHTNVSLYTNTTLSIIPHSNLNRFDCEIVVH